MKKKNIFLLSLFVFGLFLTVGTQKVSADACSDQNAGSACVDTSKVNGESGCKTGLCGGGNSVQCCSLASIKCKTDGSSFMQPCSTDGGKCNMVGECTKTYSTGTAAPTSSSSSAGGGTNFTNPLTFTNVEGFLGGIMTAIQRIIVVLALVFIMIGAVMILASAGNSGMVEKGKSAITMALVGLALGVAAPSLLKELANIIGWVPKCDPALDVNCASVQAALTLSQIAVNVLNFLLGTMGIIALIMLVIGAIMYLTSAGDEDRVKKGKEIFKYSLIGVFLAMASMVLVTQIARFFQ